MCGDVKIIIWKRYVVGSEGGSSRHADEDVGGRWLRILLMQALCLNSSLGFLSIWLKAMEKRLFLQRKRFHSHVIN